MSEKKTKGTLHSETHKNALLQALKGSLGIVTAACDEAGVSRATYYRWLADDPQFKAAAEDVAEVALDFAEHALHKQIKDGVPASTIFYLKTKGKARGYVERSEVEVTVPKPLSWLNEE